MIINYDHNPALSVDQKLQSLIENIHLALNELVDEAELAKELKNYLTKETAEAVLEAPRIVEQGVDGIWTYRKWSDGTAECWGYNTTYNHTYSAWGSIYSFDIPRIAFPTSLFISDPDCFAYARCATGNSVSSPNSNEATSVFTCGLTVIRGTSLSTTHAVTYYYAIGKWK